MTLSLNLAALRQTTAREYAIRFFFGGLVTAAAGLIANKFGPGIGGLFLAFPAIFPATATLLDAHQREKKQRAGLAGAKRGREVVSLDAAGPAQGGVGLVVFAVLIWRFVPRHNPWALLALSSLVWLAVSFGIWRLRRFPRRLVLRLRKAAGVARASHQ